MASYIERFKLQMLDRMLRQSVAAGDAIGMIFAIAEYEIWHQDFLARNSQAGKERQRYLKSVEAEIRGMSGNLMPSNMPGAGCPDGMIEIDEARILSDAGFDIVTFQGSIGEDDSLPEECHFKDGWKPARLHQTKYVRASFDSDPDELGAEIEGLIVESDFWVGPSFLPCYGHPADLGADLSKRIFSPKHNSRLGPPRSQRAEPKGFWPEQYLWQIGLADT